MTAETRSHTVGMDLIPGEETDAVVLAVQETQDDVFVERLPASVTLAAPRRIEIDPALVREHLGRGDWTGSDLQVVMSSYWGFISQFDDERIILEWLGKEG